MGLAETSTELKQEEDTDVGPKPITCLEDLQAAILAGRGYPGILTYISQNPLAASSSFTKVSRSVGFFNPMCSIGRLFSAHAVRVFDLRDIFPARLDRPRPATEAQQEVGD